MHLLSQIICSCKTLYMFRTVFPSIFRSSKLRIQQWYMSNICCYLQLSGIDPQILPFPIGRIELFKSVNLTGKEQHEELNYLYSSPSIVRVIKSGRMRWAGHVARMGGGKAYTRFWWRNLKERDHVGDPGVDGRIILRWIFRTWDVGYGLD